MTTTSEFSECSTNQISSTKLGIGSRIRIGFVMKDKINNILGCRWNSCEISTMFHFVVGRLRNPNSPPYWPLFQKTGTKRNGLFCKALQNPTKRSSFAFNRAPRHTRTNGTLLIMKIHVHYNNCQKNITGQMRGPHQGYPRSSCSKTVCVCVCLHKSFGVWNEREKYCTIPWERGWSNI